MRVLLVKLSSLGDVIHNLPAVSDLARAHPGVEIDWAVETPYAELAAMHPAVKNVLPLPMRRLKKQWWSAEAWRVFAAGRSRIAGQQYDHILDTQGLIKSTWVSSWAGGPVAGYSASSAREPLAARFYDQCVDVPRELHAVTRNRQLAAKALGYTPANAIDYGITAPARSISWRPAGPYVVLLHATSRADKMWPDSNWIELGTQLQGRGVDVVLPWGNNPERDTSQRLAKALRGAIVPPAMSLTDAATVLGQARAVVGVDTGLAHLAVALSRPTIGLYITTQPSLTGLFGGPNAINIGGGSEEAPSVPDVEVVWSALNAVTNFAQ